MSFVCHSYILIRHSSEFVCHSNFTCIYLYVICMPSVCHSYVTSMYSYVTYVSLVCSFNTNQINRLTRKCFSPVFLGLIHVKSSTLNACPISELRSAIKWLILLFWTNGIILYKKKVIENLHSKYSTETFTERCSAKTAILKKICFAVQLFFICGENTEMKFHRYGSVGFSTALLQNTSKEPHLNLDYFLQQKSFHW